jgi:tetratricopeptide (TPR) repeat protein
VEATAQLLKGLNVLAAVSDSPSRQQQELDLLITLGPALAATKGYSALDVGETLARAKMLAEQLDRSDRLVPLLYGLWAFHFIRGDHRRALSYAEQMERFGETQENFPALLLGHLYHAITCFNLGEFVAAISLLNRVTPLGDQTQRAACAGVTAEDPYVMALSWIATTLSALGHIDQARERITEALSTARQLKQPYSLAFALNFACSTASWTESANEQLRYAEELIALSTEHDFFYLLALGRFYRGHALTTLGEARDGLAALAEAHSMFQSIGAITLTPMIFGFQADAYADLGQPQEGLACLAKAAQTIGSTEERFIQSDIFRIRGDLLTAIGDRVGAEEQYHQALTVAQSQGARVPELRAAAALAGLWRDQGKRTEAHDLFSPIYSWFTEGLDTPVLKESKALLETLTA